MNLVPRVSLATLQREASATTMLWALIDVMRRLDLQVQIFHDQAHFGSTARAKVICGVESRHLDSWLMSADLCRESLAHGALGSDLAILYGRYPESQVGQPQSEHPGTGGSLEQLCHWLELPQIAVIDTSLWKDCEIPRKPSQVSAVLLDRVQPEQESHWRVQIESLWGVPVVGMLPEMARLRQSFDQPRTLGKSPCQLCTMLGSQLSKTIRLRTILELAAQAPELDTPSHIFRPGSKLSGLKIALAYDPSIDGYYSDVLDLLELQGAEVADFSPLSDPSLPSGAEVVYFGCGNPQRYAKTLSENHCLKFALRDHVRQGKRVYAEGGGAAYLCQQLVTPSGKSWPMVGLLPADAHYQETASQPNALELTLTRDHWLGRRGAQLRGYDSGHWHWETTSEMDRGLALANDGSSPMLTSEGVVGNKASINFAAQPHFLARFSSRTSHSQRAISIA